MSTLAAITLLCMMVHAILGYVGGRNESAAVHRRIALGDTRDLDHVPLVIMRIVCTFFFIAGAMAWFPCEGRCAHGVQLAALVLVALGTQAMAHRYTFNLETDHDPRYLSPGNRYDRFFLRQTVFPWPKDLRQRFAVYYNSTQDVVNWQAMIHRAGTIAYSVEAATLLAGWLLVFINPFAP